MELQKLHYFIVYYTVCQVCHYNILDCLHSRLFCTAVYFEASLQFCLGLANVCILFPML